MATPKRRRFSQAPSRKKTIFTSVRRMKRICGIIDNPKSQEKGFETEQRVDEALARLQAQGMISSFNSNGRLDRHGIDRMINTPSGSIPLQIKSSLTGLREHIAICRRTGEFIPAIVVKEGMPLELIEQEIVKIVEVYPQL